MTHSPSHIPTFVDALASLPIFKDMEAALLHGLAVSGRLAMLEKGKILLAQNQPLTRYYILLEGWCSYSKNTQNGKESILELSTRGDMLPPVENRDQHISPYSIQALTPVRVFMLPTNILRNALQQSPVFARNMVMYTGQRNQVLRDHIAQLSLASAEERIGNFLLSLRLEDGGDSNNILLPFDKSAMASYLGIKPETLSRALQEFKKRGFKINKKHIETPGHHSLCDFCTTSLAEKCTDAKTRHCPTENGGVI